MKILLHKDAATRYHQRCITGPYTFNDSWYLKLKAVEGKIIEVETRYLFIDQFNTIPIPKVSEKGMRIELYLVDQIFDDARLGKGRCLHCGDIVEMVLYTKVPFYTKVPDEKRKCPMCGAVGYIQNLDHAARSQQ